MLEEEAKSSPKNITSEETVMLTPKILNHLLTKLSDMFTGKKYKQRVPLALIVCLLSDFLKF